MLHPNQNAFFGAGLSMTSVIAIVYAMCTVLYYSLYMEISFMSEISGNIQVMFLLAIGTVITAALSTGLLIMVILVGRSEGYTTCAVHFTK